MLKNLEEALGYSFRNEELLQNALCHSSYANENTKEKRQSNERLEFLGDSILGFVVAEYLFGKYPERPEGELTRMRADLVCEESLAAVAAELKLGSYLRLGHGEELCGGRARKSINADAVESVIAAVYLDGGFDRAKDLIFRLIISREQMPGISDSDYKTMLQEYIQREKDQRLKYCLVEESGPDHDKSFRMIVLLNDRIIGEGIGRSKKRAEQAAAAQGLAALKNKK